MKQEPKQQIDKFREAARELETDQSEEVFDATLKRVAKADTQSNSQKSIRPKD